MSFSYTHIFAIGLTILSAAYYIDEYVIYTSKRAASDTVKHDIKCLNSKSDELYELYSKLKNNTKNIEKMLKKRDETLNIK